MTTVGTLEVALKATAAQFTRDLKSAGVAIGKTGDAARGLGSDLGRMSSMSQQGATAIGQLRMAHLAVVGAIAGTVKTVLELGEAYHQQEMAEKRLSLAMKNAGHSGNIGQLKSLASSLQEVTTYGDEATLQMMSMLATFGASENTISALTPRIQDMASAFGMDLNSAARLVGQAISGNVGALARYTGKIDEATRAMLENASEAERTAWVMERLSRFQGMASAEAETAHGKFKQLQGALGDVKEQLGRLIDTPVSFFLSAWTKDVLNLSDALGRLDWSVNGVWSSYKRLLGLAADQMARPITSTLEALGVNGARDFFSRMSRRGEGQGIDGASAFDMMADSQSREVEELNKRLKEMSEQAAKVAAEKSKAADAARKNAEAIARESSAIDAALTSMANQARLAEAGRSGGPFGAIQEEFRQLQTSVLERIEKSGADFNTKLQQQAELHEHLSSLMRDKLASAISDLAKEGLDTRDAFARAREAMEKLGLNAGAGFGPVRGPTRRSETPAPFQLTPYTGISVVGDDALERQHKEAQRLREQQADTMMHMATAFVSSGGKMSLGSMAGSLGSLGGPKGAMAGALIGGVLDMTVGALGDAAGRAMADALTVAGGMAGKGFTGLAGAAWGGFQDGGPGGAAPVAAGRALWYLAERSQALADLQAVNEKLFDRFSQALEPVFEQLIFGSGAAELLFTALKQFSIGILSMAMRFSSLFTKEQLASMAKSITDIAAMSLDAERAKLHEIEATDEATRAMREFTQEVRNVPTGFKVQRALFDAGTGRRSTGRENYLRTGSSARPMLGMA